jgi:hypothetical protein
MMLSRINTLAEDGNMKTKQTLKLTPELRKEIVAAVIRTWDYLADEYLQLCENGSCSADEAREVTADAGRIATVGEEKRFEQLSRKDQDSILKEAIPRGATL